MTDARPQPDDERRTEVLVRRSPRYFRFMGVGAVLGIIVAMVLTLTFPPNPEFSEAQVLAFLALFAVVLFGGLAALIALALDRAASRRSRVLTAERERGEPGA
ncbi:hypothetical protein [Clavibacter michiganensis]|uniref:Uncharacterized protein n=2 Tax=Clavibacter michiganensis TaxID=28447 RepID=A0A251YE99_9MICO|nr:hypothetical protein [Clavibacter michiganensis]MBE3079351.1 hypothetical protein [Clavibacter michiganensis subsp. michiganensis]MBF4637390.1 hypothetical protein [Clavibacter michiganensis subsp. michiganensis]MBM7412988.1 uncharacterized protein involved in exopolysaccharide biosynthesis [Clavibacter michiganensis]MBW8025637.1 hypothetical protein [Clavibacter michiganensis subsp. michiganensis]MDO4018344.1 hypothetical protein [Clavibacter michiganensis]